MKNLQPFIIFGLVAVIFFLRMCESNGPVYRKTTPDTLSVKSDTIWVLKRDTIQGKDKIILLKSEPIVSWDSFPVYKPDTTLPGLLDQYRSLGNKYFSRNTYSQSYKLDSLSDITIIDTVNQNQLVGSSFRYNLKYPSVTNTITIQEPYKPVTQLYVGGGVSGNPTNLISGFEAGLLLKNKRDQIYGVKAGIGTNGQINYTFSSYWKISLRKK